MKKNRQLKSTWVAKEMLEVFQARPHWPAKDIIETIRRAYKVVVKKDFAYKVKYYAHKMLHGSVTDHYRKLGRYMATLKASSPYSILDLVVDSSKQPPVFQRFFCCFEGIKKGWIEGCRRIICVDAAFLKTFLGGQILSAVGRDANEQMFPLAWGAVEGENTMSWTWFMTHLQTCLELGDGTGTAIVSDQHPAIISAVASVLPKAEHRHCARHIFLHWHMNFRGDEFKLQFWKIAMSYSLADFNDAMDELVEINPDAAVAFKAYNPECFCRAFMDPSIKSDAITNNMAETFNGYIVNARTKHLIYMMEDIRVALMQRLMLKREHMEKQTSVLCPRIQTMLEKEKGKAAYCEVLPSTANIFNVRHNLDQMNVDLESRTCTCKKWDLMGVPCCHACACIFFLNREAEEYVENCYKREAYLKAYGGSIPPIEGERHWPRVDCIINPPAIKIGPGRPRKNRIKDPFEDPKKPGSLTRHGMEMTCSLCKVKGHNKRKCPNKDTTNPPEPQPKKPRGRPRNEFAPPINQVASTSTSSSVKHHATTAHPTQLGRGGRMILGGIGAKSGGTGRGRGRGNNTLQATGRGREQVGSSSVQGRGQTGSTIGQGRWQSGKYAGHGRGRGQNGSGSGKGRGRGMGKTPIGVGVFTSITGWQVINPHGTGSGQRINASIGTQSSQASVVNHSPP